MKNFLLWLFFSTCSLAQTLPWTGNSTNAWLKQAPNALKIGQIGSTNRMVFIDWLTVTNPVTASITGNAGTANALQTTRTINGVGFDGTANITVTAAGSTLSDTVPISKGGTGVTTASAAVDALGGAAATGSGGLVRATSPTLVTPNIGVATATSVNGNTITSGSGTLTLQSGVNSFSTIAGPPAGTGLAVSATSQTGNDAITVTTSDSSTPSGNVYGTFIRHTISHPGTGTLGFANGGSVGELIVDSGNTHNYTARQSGTYGYVHHSGSGTLSDAQGSHNIVLLAGSGTIFDAKAVSGEVSTDTGSTGSIVNGIALYAHSPNVLGASIQNVYGLYLQNNTQGTTNNFGFYSEGPQKNYVGGKLLFGTTTDSGNGVIQLAASSSATNGIAFGTSASEVIYRNGTDSIVVGPTTRFDKKVNFADDVKPTVNASFDVGSSSLKFRNGWFSGTFAAAGTSTLGAADFSGNVSMTAGKTLSLSSGSNQRAGNAVLVGGTKDVSNTTVTASTVVMLTRKTAGGTTGELTYTLNAGTSFTINSASGTDTSTVSYLLIEVP